VEKIKEELADIFSFALLLADKYSLDVKQIVQDKIAQNRENTLLIKQKALPKNTTKSESL
jgi:hypothetical protein